MMYVIADKLYSFLTTSFYDVIFAIIIILSLSLASPSPSSPSPPLQWSLLSDYTTVFCNIEEVCELSGKLATSLKEACQGEGSGVGVVFKQYATQIKEVYGTYCREHDSASQLLEKVGVVT